MIRLSRMGTVSCRKSISRCVTAAGRSRLGRWPAQGSSTCRVSASSPGSRAAISRKSARSRPPESARPGALTADRSMSTFFRPAPSGAASCTSKARLCISRTSSRTVSPASGPRKVSTFSSTAPAMSPASISASSRSPNARSSSLGSCPGSPEHNSAMAETRSGRRAAISTATRPPYEEAIRAACSMPRVSSRSSTSSASLWRRSGRGLWPKPRKSQRTTRYPASARAYHCGSHILRSHTAECSSTSAGPSPPHRNQESCGRP